MTPLSRRSLITGLASLLATPSIVRASSLMPVRGYILRGNLNHPLWICGVADGGQRVREYVEAGVDTITKWRRVDGVSFEIPTYEIDAVNLCIPTNGRQSSVASLHPQRLFDVTWPNSFTGGWPPMSEFAK